MSSEMAVCPQCERAIRPVIDEAATPDGDGECIAGGTWICPECETISGISEVDIL